MAFRFLPLSALPEVDYPTIQVQTFYPGASPEVMTSAVTAPLERQFGQMASLNQMMSASSAGASIITLRFGLDIGLDIAEQEVQQAINAAGNLLPADLPAPPIYAKVNPADAPILTLGVASDAMKLTEVEDIIETRLVPKLSELPGVGLVSISGGQRPAVRIHVNPLALSSLGINLDDLRTTIANLNVNEPKGNFDGPAQASAINANDQIRDPNDYAKSVIAYRNGAPVRLSDVANVEIGPENGRLKAWMNTTPALIVNIQRQPGANVIKVVDSVKALLPSLRELLPAAITLTPLTDRTITISRLRWRRRVRARARGRPGRDGHLPVPAQHPRDHHPEPVGAALADRGARDHVSGGFQPRQFVAHGADGRDRIRRRRRDRGDREHRAFSRARRQSSTEAAMKGSAQIGFTIISLTVSLIAVLIPLLFMGDVVGRLFHEFAITLASAIILSAVVSLTLVPMPCAKLLRPQGHGGEASGGRFFQALTRFYGATLRVALNHQGIMLLVALGTFLLTGYLYMTIPKGFFPIQDTGVIQGVTQAAEAISFDQMADHQQALAKAILTDPDVESLSSFIGVDGSNVTLNSGRFLINLKPHAKRTATASEVIRRLQRETANVPGISLFMQPVQDLSIDTAVSATQYQFTLENQDLTTLQTWTPKVLQRLSRDSFDCRCGQRFAAGRTLGDRRSRPRQCGALRHHPGHRRQCALRRLRPAHHLDNLHPEQPIPRHPRRLSLHGALDEVASIRNLTCRPRPPPPARRRSDRSPISPSRPRPCDLRPRTVSGDDDLVQPRAGAHSARRSMRSAGAQGDPTFRRASPRSASRARRRRFNRHCPTRCSCSWRPLRPCISCLACSMRASSTQSRILTTLPSAGIGALLTLNVAGAGLDIIGVIGIVLPSASSRRTRS